MADPARAPQGSPPPTPSQPSARARVQQYTDDHDRAADAWHYSQTPFIQHHPPFGQDTPATNGAPNLHTVPAGYTPAQYSGTVPSYTFGGTLVSAPPPNPGPGAAAWAAEWGENRGMPQPGLSTASPLYSPYGPGIGQSPDIGLASPYLNGGNRGPVMQLPSNLSTQHVRQPSLPLANPRRSFAGSPPPPGLPRGPLSPDVRDEDLARRSRRRRRAQDTPSSSHPRMSGFLSRSASGEYPTQLMGQAQAQRQAHRRHILALGNREAMDYAKLLEGPFTVATLHKKLQRSHRRYPADLPPEERSCYMCIKEYEEFPVNNPSADAENAVKLDCGHVFGEYCLIHWLSTCEKNRNKVTCPTCRALLVQTPPRLPHIPTPEQLAHLPLRDQMYLENEYESNRYRCRAEDFNARHRRPANAAGSAPTRGQIMAQAMAIEVSGTVRRLASGQRRPQDRPSLHRRNLGPPADPSRALHPHAILQDLLPREPGYGGMEAEDAGQRDATPQYAGPGLQRQQEGQQGPPGGMVVDTQWYLDMMRETTTQPHTTQPTQHADYSPSP